MLQQRPDGALYVVTGASRSGKTAWTMQQVRGAERALIWDPEAQWSLGNAVRCEGRAQLVTFARDGRRARIAYVPNAINPTEFAFFCRVAWLYLQAAPATIVIEELADVTTPGKAPDEWGLIVRRGLKYGANLYAITQRPAESDKTIMGNATVMHVHRMARAQDREYMAREMDLPTAKIATLAPLEFIEKDARTGEIRTGKVTFKGRRKP